jgi:tetratricopeptide (TPR) repeat protein
MPLILIIYAIIIILGLFLVIYLWDLEVQVLGVMGIPASSAIYFVIGAIIGLSTLICLWSIFRKEGRPGWAAIIPIYNGAVLCQIAGYGGRYVWLFFIPIVNIIAILRVCMGVAENFGQSTRFGVCLFLFNPIFLPILAFSKKIQYDYAAKVSLPANVAPHSTREYFERKAAQECFDRAGELETAGEREQAIEQYTKAIHINSRYTIAYFKRGTLLMDSGSKAAAITDFRCVIELGDDPQLSNSARENLAKLE